MARNAECCKEHLIANRLKRVHQMDTTIFQLLFFSAAIRGIPLRCDFDLALSSLAERMVLYFFSVYFSVVVVGSFAGFYLLVFNLRSFDFNIDN